MAEARIPPVGHMAVELGPVERVAHGAEITLLVRKLEGAGAYSDAELYTLAWMGFTSWLRDNGVDVEDAVRTLPQGHVE